LRSRTKPLVAALAAMYRIESLEPRTLLSTATLIADTNTGTLNSNARPVAVVGATAYFIANDGINGTALWKATGSPPTASLVLPVGATGQNQTYIDGPITGVAFNNQCFFNVTTYVTGSALWKSDGTPAGTVLVQTINHDSPGDFFNSSPAPQNYIVAANKLFFTAPTDSTGTASALWVSDGTGGGTKTIGQIVPALSGTMTTGAAVLANKIYFLVNDNSSPKQQSLYVTDGTATGTSLVSSLSSSSTWNTLTVCNGKLYFLGIDSTNHYTLWTSNGLSTGTSAVTAIQAIAGTQLFVSGANLFMACKDQANSSLQAVWKSDGTAAGTTQVQGGFTGYQSLSTLTFTAALPNGSVFFEATSGANSGAFITDGTPTGTRFLSTAPQATTFYYGDHLADWAVIGSTAFFTGNDAAHGYQLWRTDGTVTGTTVVTINPNSDSYPAKIIAANGLAYLSANNGVSGVELWQTDGSAANTRLVADVNTQAASGNAQPVSAINGEIYLNVQNQFGSQPWISDGTTAGTHMIAVVDPLGSGGAYAYLPLGNKVFFYTNGGINGGIPWMTDGTSGGTVRLTASDGHAIGVENPCLFGNYIYFSGIDAANGHELWRTDGTSAGTVLVADINPGATSSNPTGLTVLNGALIFGANGPSGQAVYSLTPGSSPALLRVMPGFGYPTLGAGKIFFIYFDSRSGQGGLNLAQTDGTVTGTSTLRSITPTLSGAGQPVTIGNDLYFVAADSQFTAIQDLYRYDSQGNLTVLFDEINTSIYSLTVVGNRLFFAAEIPGLGYGSALYISDGTQAGTVPVLGRNAIANAMFPGSLTNIGGILYFNGTDTSHGQELWRSDGTAAGTYLLCDINPGPGSGSPYLLLPSGGSIYMQANDGIHGSEFMRVDGIDSIRGTSGADQITLRANTDHQHIDWSIGTATGQVLTADPAGLTILGIAGNDFITLDSSNGNPLPNFLHLDGAFTISGLANGPNSPLIGKSIDLGASTLYISYAAGQSPALAIQQALTSGYNSGAWNGATNATIGTISSSAAASAPAGMYSIGYADSADGVVTGQPANTVEVRFTVAGDTNLDRTVNSTDAIQMARHYLATSSPAWDLGNFNYDTTINLSDATLLQKNFNATASGTATPATVSATLTDFLPVPITTTAKPPTDSPDNLDPQTSKSHPRPRKQIVQKHGH
jgi:ELWxxDGT repeat protein